MSNLVSKDFSSEQCWEWHRSTAGNGYGVLSFNKKNHYVHRVSYRLFVGELKNGDVVCHRCDNPKCFNPNHLFVGTQKTNVQDMIKKGRRISGNHQGENNANCKFSDETILKIRSDYHSGISARDLKSSYGVSGAQLYRITRYLTRPNIRPEGFVL